MARVDSLVGLFVSTAGETRLDGDLEETLVARIAEAQATWPQLSVPAEAFVVHLAEKVRGAPALVASLRELNASDLYLACGCSRGDPAALACFETRCLAKLDRPLSALGAAAAQIEETKQILRHILFLPEPAGAEAHIRQYGGRGALPAWVRVVAVRTAVRLLRRIRREVPLEQEMLDALPPVEDPEVQYLRETYRAVFKQAFKEALSTLPEDQLMVLQQRYLDGLSASQIAALHRVDRRTVSRWVEQARWAVLDQTRRALMAELRLDPDECDSVMRLVRSHLSLTFRSLFGR